MGLPLAVDDETAGRIIRRDRNGHSIAKNNSDAKATSTTRKLSQDLVSVLALDAKVSALADVNHFAL